MGRLISCEFNRDTVCIELKFTDGSMIAIDMNTVENEVADNTMPWEKSYGQFFIFFL